MNCAWDRCICVVPTCRDASVLWENNQASPVGDPSTEDLRPIDRLGDHIMLRTWGPSTTSTGSGPGKPGGAKGRTGKRPTRAVVAQ